MDARELTLNIAVNLGRLSRWAMEGKQNRITQFLAETEEYLRALEVTSRSVRFESTFQRFKQKFAELKQTARHDEAWAEEALTWASILTHRAKLA